MLNLAEYRQRPALLADWLPWAGLVAPGVVLNKDGSFQRTARFRGPDLDSATQGELIATTARLNNVVSSGIKVLVLAVIVGIGTGLFAEFPTTPSEPSIDHALVVMLASLALLALGIYGPGIATDLVSGAPQLGAGAMAGAAVGAA